MSSVFVEPNQFVSQTSAMICSRVTTPPGPRGEQGQEVELLRAQIELLAADPGPAGVDVDRHRPDLDPAGRCRSRLLQAPGMGADAGEQLGEPKRLGHVVVGAGVEPGDDVELAVPGGQDQDREVGARPAQIAADGDPVDVRRARGRGRRCPRTASPPAALAGPPPRG